MFAHVWTEADEWEYQDTAVIGDTYDGFMEDDRLLEEQHQRELDEPTAPHQWQQAAAIYSDGPHGDGCDLAAEDTPCDRCGYNGPGCHRALYETDENWYHWLCDDCAGEI